MESKVTRYEEYRFRGDEPPFVLYPSNLRSPRTLSHHANWHESAEIEWVIEGAGVVRIGGQAFPVSAGDTVVIAPGEIHHTATDDFLRYGCLIVDSDFCRQIGIDPAGWRTAHPIRDERLTGLFSELCDVSENRADPCRTAKSYRALISLLIYLCESVGAGGESGEKVESDRASERIKAAVRYVNDHYAEQITLDGIAGELFIGKYQLSREFKRYTGMTVVTYLERLRCAEAAALIRGGCPVGEAAERVGFRNMSFFTRMFKREYGCLPSSVKKRE